MVRNFCHDGHGQQVAILLVAGRWVPLSRANNNVPHVLEVRVYEGDLPMQGKPFVFCVLYAPDRVEHPASCAGRC